jgi:hypothetical protein
MPGVGVDAAAPHRRRCCLARFAGRLTDLLADDLDLDQVVGLAVQDAASLSVDSRCGTWVTSR